MGEYVPYQKLESIIREEKKQGKVVVLTGGCFDIVHEGHHYLFRKARELGDILVINVVNDGRVRMYKGEERPIRKSRRRAIVVAGQVNVDYSSIHPSVSSGPTIGLGLIIKPDVIVKSGWDPGEIERLKEVFDYDVELKTIPRSRIQTSTTSILEGIREPKPKGFYGIGKRVYFT